MDELGTFNVKLGCNKLVYVQDKYDMYDLYLILFLVHTYHVLVVFIRKPTSTNWSTQLDRVLLVYYFRELDGLYM